MARNAAIHERSAGVVIYRLSGTDRFYLLLDYGKYWGFAKGGLDQQESDKEAALREVREETGITDLRFDPDFSREERYIYRRSGRLCVKTVVMFLGQTTQTTATISNEHVGWEFLAFHEAVRRLKYPATRQVLQAAEAHLADAAIAVAGGATLRDSP